MRRGAWADDLAAIRAEAEDDTIHARVLMQLGVPEGTIYRRCRDGGPWTLMAPATIRLSTGTPTRRQLLRAALVYAGGLAVLTGIDGARAHGLRRGELPSWVYLLIPAGLRVQALPWLRIERTTRPLQAVTRDGLPVASLARSVIDAARRMRAESDIAAVLSEPVQQRMILPQHLVDEMEKGNRRGTATPRKVLRAVTAGARSAGEFDFYRWWFVRPELAAYEVLFNVRLSVAGEFLGIADAYLPGVGLVLPNDSVERHFMTPEQVIDTERQHRAYRAAGLHVYGIRPSRMKLDPAGLLQDVLLAIATAAELPTPLVRWQPDLPQAV